MIFQASDEKHTCVGKTCNASVQTGRRASYVAIPHFILARTSIYTAAVACGIVATPFFDNSIQGLQRPFRYVIISGQPDQNAVSLVESRYTGTMLVVVFRVVHYWGQVIDAFYC